MQMMMLDDGGLFGYAQAGTRRFRMEGSKDATKITEIDTDAYGRNLHPVRNMGMSHRGVSVGECGGWNTPRFQA